MRNKIAASFACYIGIAWTLHGCVVHDAIYKQPSAFYWIFQEKNAEMVVSVA